MGKSKYSEGKHPKLKVFVPSKGQMDKSKYFHKLHEKLLLVDYALNIWMKPKWQR